MDRDIKFSDISLLINSMLGILRRTEWKILNNFLVLMINLQSTLG